MANRSVQPRPEEVTAFMKCYVLYKTHNPADLLVPGSKWQTKDVYYPYSIALLNWFCSRKALVKRRTDKLMATPEGAFAVYVLAVCYKFDDLKNRLKDTLKKDWNVNKNQVKDWLQDIDFDQVKQDLADAYNKYINDKSITDLHENLDSELEESIEKHDTLNPKLWNNDNTLKDEVADKIMEIVDDFTSQLEDNEIKFDLADVKLVGSNCSYNYTDDSDLDVHLVMNTGSLNCPDNLYPLLYGAYRTIYNKNHDISFYGIPVEIFVETDDTKQMSEARQQTALLSNGIYSVLNKEWIKEPVQEDIPDVDQDAVDELVDEWTEKLDKAVDSGDPEKIAKCIEDLYEVRKTSIVNEGEYGVGNYAFKELRNSGKLDAVRDAKGKLVNRQLSLESLGGWYQLHW